MLNFWSFNTWLISSWEENNCCYKLSNWKWQLFSLKIQNDNFNHFEFHPPKVSSTPSHLMLIWWFWVLSARPWAIWSVLSVSLEVVDQTKGPHICSWFSISKISPKKSLLPLPLLHISYMKLVPWEIGKDGLKNCYFKAIRQDNGHSLQRKFQQGQRRTLVG